MNLKNNINVRKIIITAVAVTVCVSNGFFSFDPVHLFAEESDDGVITLPFIPLTDIEDTDDTDNQNEDVNPDDDETELVTDDGSIKLPFIPFEEDDETLPGDINEDGVVSAADLAILRLSVLNASDYDKKADLNNDSKIDVQDLVKLVRIVLGD